MIRRRSLRTRAIKMLVLDEADEMLNKGTVTSIFYLHTSLKFSQCELERGADGSVASVRQCVLCGKQPCLGGTGDLKCILVLVRPIIARMAAFQPRQMWRCCVCACAGGTGDRRVEPRGGVWHCLGWSARGV